MTMPLTIRVVHTAADLPATVDRLAPSLYYTRQFLRAYERHPVQHVVDRRYLLVEDAGVPVGFAPCYVQGDPLDCLDLGPDGRALVSHLWHCPDGRLVGTSSRVATLLAATMREVADDLGLARAAFVNVEVGSPSARTLEAAGHPGVAIDTRYRLDLTGVSTEDGYLARLKIGPRHEYRRQLNRAVEAGVKMTIRPAEPDEPADKLRLLERSAARLGSPGYYDARRIVGLLGELAGPARINEIWLGDDLLAIGILFVDAQPGAEPRLHAWAAGYERERRLPFSPYYLLHACAVRYALELGLPTIEGGRRNDEFKMRYGMTPTPLGAHVVNRQRG
ncbi:GNAT family N-acetyltransferase [Planosporangium sp. 12N6]|uniref:GNAT family N-acetyltransferase n=1 Tax=Planosporangium spinosum TaxID=3402278 RepID=UPI003CEFE1D7